MKHLNSKKKILAQTLKLVFFALALANNSFLLANTSSNTVPEWIKNTVEDKQVDDRDLHPTDVILWSVKEAQVYKDGQVAVSLLLETKKNFALYQTELRFETASGIPIASVISPSTEELLDPLTDKKVNVYKKGLFTLIFTKLSSLPDKDFKLSVRYLGCTRRICLFPYKQSLSAKLRKTKALLPIHWQEKISQKENQALITAEKIPPKSPTPLQSFNNLSTENLNPQNGSLLFLLFIAFLGGILTNLTPCVYPMIPITLRLLSHKAKSPYLSASFYAAGIMLTYGSLGLVAASSGQMFGQFMGLSWVNLLLALIMGLLAFSMLFSGGFAWLQKLGLKMGGGAPSLWRSMLMGVGAGFVASPCTGPILAGLIAYGTTQSDSYRSILLFFTYSGGFALPYILLGGMAQKITQIKLGASLQIAVKTFFAAIMFTLAFYYLRIPLYPWLKQLSSPQFWTVCFFVLLALGAATFWLITTQIAYPKNQKFLLIPALLLSLSFFSSVRWWELNASWASRNNLFWFVDENKALLKARNEKLPLLIDMWAEWCTACKEMDKKTFGQKNIIQTLKEKKWVLLKLDLTSSDEYSKKIQSKYQVPGLPTLILIPPGKDLSAAIKLSGFVSSEKLLKTMGESLN